MNRNQEMSSYEDPSCVKFCDRKEHGDFINAAITKRSIKDKDICAYLNYICVLCGSSRDSYGRTALHMAASCGRTDVCKWLVCQKQAKIDEKDKESGYTALHRAVFYGKIDTAVALIKLGTTLNHMDLNDMMPLDHALLDNVKHFKPIEQPLIYFWGANSNYTLGALKEREFPDVFDVFHKAYPCADVINVYLEKFHTVILTNVQVFAFGIGQGGRLGIGSEKTVLEPQEIKFNTPTTVVNCAVARDHSLFLTDAQEVWSCGLNTHHVLGISPPPTHQLLPRLINKLKGIENIAAARYHSVAWTSSAVYTWGYNGGQLGHMKADDATTIILPKAIKCLNLDKRKVISVAASNGATAILTDQGDVYVLHEYQCRSIASKNIDLVRVCAYGGKLAMIDVKRDDLRVVAQTKTGNLFIWQETDPQFCRCTFSLNRLLKVHQFALNANGLVLLTHEREVFNGRFRVRKRKNILVGKKNFNNFLDKNDCVMILVDRVPRIYGATSIICDLEGNNFAALHLNTTTMVRMHPQLPISTLVQDIERMVNSSDIDCDMMFSVKGRVFGAHRYVIRQRSKKLADLPINSEGYVLIQDVDPLIFQEVLQFVYISKCALMREGVIPEHLRNLHTKKDSDAIRLLREAAKRLGVDTLYRESAKFEIVDGNLQVKGNAFHKWRFLEYSRATLPEFYDVRIKTSCGQRVDAHRCILSARCEYFAHTFSTRWMQGEEHLQKIELPADRVCICDMLDYLYQDTIDLSQRDVDHLVNLLILADHIMLDRLVAICEEAFTPHITIKNVLRLLHLAEAYNATQLKDVCNEFVCFNLALFLESRHLEQVDVQLLQDLTRFYAEWNSLMAYRVITPYSGAVSDEIVLDIGSKRPVKMEFDEIVKAPTVRSTRRRNRLHRPRLNDSSLSESENLPEYILTNNIDTVDGDNIDNRVMTAPIRISAIRDAHQRINDTPCVEDFVSLSLKSPKEFPGLVGASDTSQKVDNHQSQSLRTPKQWTKLTRISQRERKRLSSEGSKENAGTSEIQENAPVIAASPKNPWNMSFESASPSSACVFGDVITEERQQRVNLHRIKSKLLIYTQMEDKALEELERFYNADQVIDEIIEVRRVECGQIAAPLWIHKQNV